MLARLRRDDRGDTIVEVMIVLAVLGLALGISYATANRSLLNARQAQENSQATKITQSQVENLFMLASSSDNTNTDPTSNIFLPTQPYCILDPHDAHPIKTDPASCIFGATGLYKVQIYNCNKIIPAGTPCNGVSDANTFITQTTWPDVVGQGTDTVTLAYKVHP